MRSSSCLERVPLVRASGLFGLVSGLSPSLGAAYLVRSKERLRDEIETRCEDERTLQVAKEIRMWGAPAQL